MSMSNRGKLRFSLKYLFFGVPFILGYLSWCWFPILCHFIIGSLIGYTPSPGSAPLIWSLVVWFFYTWYTFLAIVVGGVLLVASWVWQRRRVEAKVDQYPKSFIHSASL